MRIYLAVTGTGEVKGSFEVGEIYIKKKQDSYYVTLERIDNKNIGLMLGIELFGKQGYANQKYAIEIKDFKQEKLFIFKQYCKKQKCFEFKKQYFEAECDDCNSYHNEMIMKPRNMEYIIKTPQGFQYINDPETDETAILMPIHQKWFDMIASGEKEYEFRNILPKILRSEK